MRSYGLIEKTYKMITTEFNSRPYVEFFGILSYIFYRLFQRIFFIYWKRYFP